MTRLALVALILLLAAPAFAQPSPDACTAADYTAVLSDAVEALAKPNADTPALITDLVSQLRAQQASCAGLAFEGSSGGIVGPLELPAGSYIVEVTLGTVGSVTATALDASCERDLLGFFLATFDFGGGGDGGIIQLDEDCTVAFDVGVGPWTLTLTPVQ